ncbi:hypothetical protein AVEN_155618-1 [Araneus ventricosus]|uniref:Uncharacterized protein n=1 Tax=Araneus ventricosus TaxID=182803 RepID=A0A4Y2U4R9_ARAVE|nr:hypothetical protein AVEN_57965-1 [Araneus ventricosus]GBO06577.1 hypothetical protein AVEN_155618-1 [Araneus ventricosus]
MHKLTQCTIYKFSNGCAVYSSHGNRRLLAVLFNNILWSDEAHFYLHGTVNTHNCRMWDSQNPHAFQQIPLESSKPVVWCGFTASFILVLYFCVENGVNAAVTRSINAQRYRTMLLNFVILQLRRCLQSIVFMQDGAFPHWIMCSASSTVTFYRRTDN